MRRLCILLLLSCLVMTVAYSKDNAVSEKKTIVKLRGLFNINGSDEGASTTNALLDLMKSDPEIEINAWGGISLPSSGESSLLMSLAGKTSPDIGRTLFHTIQNNIKQNFLYPLNEWIGDDLDGDGHVSGNEVKWKEWNNYKPLWKTVCSKDGKIYGIPVSGLTIQGMVFRIDLVKEAGLDPSKPPRNWDEFYEWCKALTMPNKIVKGATSNYGQRALCLPTSGYMFLPWIYAAGGEPFIQIRKSPRTGRAYSFSIVEEKFTTPEGEDLSHETSDWRANWDTEEGRAALNFWYKLRWGEFEKDGERVSGVVLPDSARQRDSYSNFLGTGEVAMMAATIDDLTKIARSSQLDPSLLSWFPYPAGPGEKGRPCVQIFQHFCSMYANVKDRPKEERDKIWKVLLTCIDKDTERLDVEQCVLGGMASFVSPDRLREYGFEEYIKDVPQAIQDNFKAIDDGSVISRTEPYAGHWLTINDELIRRVIGIMLGANGKDFNYLKAFSDLQVAANSGLMFEMPEEFLAARRPYALAIMIVMICIFLFVLYKIIFSYNVKKVGSRSVYSGWLPVLLLIPALSIITCWRYYPLLRGMVMALQDYKVVGESKFVGLDNFINLVYNRDFWISIWRTCYYVVLHMTLVFLAPIILAVLLTEVPKGKIFFRTLFFLPQMTSGVVIALLWKMLYSTSATGYLNQLIALLNRLPGVDIPMQTWLQDPKLAMICCIIPTVWAGMGMSSLIYLAALQSLPRELYEAADVDGATWWQKFFKITIPYLLPLIIINFVGSFIGTFQGMGNIFLLTFGGPGDATMVIGMKIWQEAYAYLHFSMATCMAWVMGAGLIGLTYIQIQFLKKVEYKKASE